jgi:hypothetical protein
MTTAKKRPRRANQSLSTDRGVKAQKIIYWTEAKLQKRARSPGEAHLRGTINRRCLHIFRTVAARGGVLRALRVQEFPQFLFGLEKELLTAALRPTCPLPELLGAQGDVWHFRHHSA